MAPVKATAVGITPQTIDDEELLRLEKDLNDIVVKSGNGGEASTDAIDRLVTLVARYPDWNFEEQVDLHEWIPALNAFDAALIYFIQKFPELLLVASVDQKENIDVALMETLPAIDSSRCAHSLQQAESVSDSVIQSLCDILQFLSNLLHNSINKVIFNSVEPLVALLAASNDTVATLSLKALSHLATPPSLHKQQAPEGHQHTSALHGSKQSHKRLVALARGWGSRGSGLGLYACVTADDSEFGHGSLPLDAGEVRFEFFAPDDSRFQNSDGESKALDNSKLVSIHLTAKDIVTVPIYSADAIDSMKLETIATKQKRQRTGMEDLRPRGMHTKSTAALFFQCLDAAGGRDRISEDRLFVLLADIRLSKSFHAARSRVAAVENRLLALIAILHAHPSQDIMSGYFQAQPELCVELIDLLHPTVSSGSVSSGSTQMSGTTLRAIEALSCPIDVPYTVRNLAVEALTALVARRDGASGGLTGVARQSNILNELGVGKGMYLGLLPTLVRFSLASLTNFLTAKPCFSEGGANSEDENDVALDVGLAFLVAVKQPPVPEKDQIMRAISFVDNVLSLTSAIISAPSGTAALTDCGIIPALLGTVSLDSNALSHVLSSLNLDLKTEDQSRIQAQIRFVASQAIQIIEGAIVTHSNALSAFHDLSGVDILVTRLQEEMIKSKEEHYEELSDRMDVYEKSRSEQRKLVASRRVLLFSIVNCLTVAFHQESPTSAQTPNSGSQLRKPEMTFALTEVIEHIDSYGGVLAALTCSLLSDVMNSDPHVVYHVHQSGISQAFFNMMARDIIREGVSEPAIPTVPELIMALPNVISALSLTAEGAGRVKDSNPFPSMLRVLHHPKYAMPRSRCLLNDMTAIVGTGLDELMRHVPSLRDLVMESIVLALKELILLGKSLMVREEQAPLSDVQDASATPLENERTCLMHYTLNLGQMLEQILHSEDHCAPFVDHGGLAAALELFQLLVPPTTQFLANACCLSSPSISTLAHTTTEDSLSVIFRCVAINYNSQKMLKLIADALEVAMDRVQATQGIVRASFSTRWNGESIDAFGILEDLPKEPIYETRKQINYGESANCLADYLRAVVILQWQTCLLATIIKAALQRSQDTSWGRKEREWKNELSSESFQHRISRLAEFHHSAILESCRIRSDDEFESNFRKRHIKFDDSLESIRYRLRIVCQEGAVVRDGIEIDSCSNIGSMEMGEVADAYERCVNASGVMRYRTRRGWISELTRGHGREPIAEVLDVTLIESSKVPKSPHSSTIQTSKRRMEYDVASFHMVGSSVLARLQTSHREFFGALSRVVSSGVRSLPARPIAFETGTVGAHTQVLLKLLSSNMSAAMNQTHVVNIVGGGQDDGRGLNNGGVAMYLGLLLGIISSSLYEDKRERRTVNVALLLALLSDDNQFLCIASPALNGHDICKSESLPVLGLFSAIKFIVENSLQSVASLRDSQCESTPLNPFQSLNRITAASLPPVIAILRRLMAGVPMKQSPVTSILERMDFSDLEKLLGCPKVCLANNVFCRFDAKVAKFSPERFVRSIYFGVADLILPVWKDPRFRSMPSHVIHPITTLSIEILGGLEDIVKPSSAIAAFFSRIGRVSRPSDNDQPDQQRTEPTESVFEPSEDAIAQLMEMGFSREHALDSIESTESNRLEVAMEYALSHPPPSPGAVARRLEERQRNSRGSETQERTESGSQFEDAIEGAGNADDDKGTRVAGADSDADGVGNEGSAREDEMNETTALKSVTTCLENWVKGCPSVAISLLSDIPDACRHAYSGSAEGSGNPETEALAVVVCSFLVNLCQRYPDKSDMFVVELLSRLKQNFVKVQDGERTLFRVKEGKELCVSTLCHACVLFARAIPRTRVLLLEQDLLSCLTACLSDFSEALDDPEYTHTTTHWPIWLAPSILLVDVMAQPQAVVAFPGRKQDALCDLEVVREQHCRQVEQFSMMTNQLITAVYKGAAEARMASLKEALRSSAHNTSERSRKESLEAIDVSLDTKSPFSSLPSFFPLISDSMAKTAMECCLRILGKEAASREGRSPPPGTTHATLLLLTRLLRCPKRAADCLREGAPNLILSLPRESRFNGNAGLVTVVLRRLLEDDANLMNAMETEVRSACISIHRKQSRQSAPPGEPSAPFNVFLQAVTPLLCRDQWTFVKALVSTVSFTPKNTPGGQHTVTLLTQEERQRNVRLLSEITMSQSRAGCAGESPKKQKSSSQKRSSKINAPNRNSLPRRGSSARKGKKEKHDASALNGTPANHVMSLMVERMVHLAETADGSSGENPGSFGEVNSFLWVADVIEIMADLVLAFPACAAAIHRYRHLPSKGPQNDPLSRLTNALAGCPPPLRTVVNFLLHMLIPQDRWTYRHDHGSWDKSDQQGEARKRKNKESFIKTKVAQATSRLLVALVARPGEGRRRVVADLSSALSVGRHNLDANDILSKTNPPKVSTTDDVGIFALQAWGDLCMGLAAPRSNGVNHDNNSNLSLEVVKLMLEYKMANSLLNALDCVDLNHPMAASACASLLVPLEVFTRGSVTDAVQALADKEALQKDVPSKTGRNLPEEFSDEKPRERDSEGDGSQRREPSFADDFMLGDGFDAAAASGRLHLDDDEEEESDDEVEMENVEGDGEALNEDVHMEGRSVDDEEIESEDDDGSEMDSDEGDEDDDNDDDDDEEDDSDSEEDDEDDVIVEEEVEDDDDGVDTNEEWDPNGGYNYFDDTEGQEGDDDDQGRADNDLDDWDQIEAPPFGGLMLGARRRRGNLSSRGFVDAAEAMIGTLLRTGEIQGDALAEIEGTLGFRLNANRTLPDWMERGSNIFPSSDDGRQIQGPGRNASDSNVIGAMPRVNQRRPPDVGHSGPLGGGRWNDVSSVEFVFGGPTLTGGSRNFDVISVVQSRDDNHTYALPSAVDSQLFPGGPAASTHTRTQQTSHPLLSDIDLPPVNSLVSDLASHGERSTRRAQITTRRGDGWATLTMAPGTGEYTLTAPNGNMSRISQGPDHMGMPPHASSGFIGWTDDGQPFDNSAGNFSAAFESAINEAILMPNEASMGVSTNDVEPASQGIVEMEATDRNASFERSNEEDEDGNNRAEGVSLPGSGAGAAEPMMDAELIRVSTASDDAAGTAAETRNESIAPSLSTSSVNAADPSSIDGEGVAQALVEGLCLTDGTADLNGSSADELIEETHLGVREEENVSVEEVENEGIVAELGTSADAADDQPNVHGLICPPGMDRDVFNCLPEEMQQEVVGQHLATLELMSQLDGTFGLDPEALAALPEEMRREVIAHEQRERRLRESSQADPSNAEEMDNASFVASLAPDLRQEILLTADGAFLSSLPPDIIAESQILRERASHQQRRLLDPTLQAGDDGRASVGDRAQGPEEGSNALSTTRKRLRHGKMMVECDRSPIIFLPARGFFSSTAPIGSSELKSLIQLMFLLSPVRPQRLLQKVLQNICVSSTVRGAVISVFTRILDDDSLGTRSAVECLDNAIRRDERNIHDFDFPPRALIGATPDVLDSSCGNLNNMFFRRRHGSSCAASIAASLPTSLRGSSSQTQMPPVVSTRVIDTLSFLSKNSTRVCLDILTNSIAGVDALQEGKAVDCFELMLDLLRKTRFIQSSTNLEHLLTMIEIMTSPLASLSRVESAVGEVSTKDIETAAATGKEWVDIPRRVVSQARLQLLCSILKMESCREAAFAKVNVIASRLCKVEANRGHVLGELASVAQALGNDAKRDLRALLVRMNDAVSHQKTLTDSNDQDKDMESRRKALKGGNPSRAVTLSNSNSELKLMRVLQTLQSLCSDIATDDGSRKKSDSALLVTVEQVEIMQGINLSELWEQLSACLKVVRVLEGIATADEVEARNGDNGDDTADDNAITNDVVDEGSDGVLNSGKKLQNSSAGLLTRFLPAIEAFFVVHASSSNEDVSETSTLEANEGVNALNSVPSEEHKCESAGFSHVAGKQVINFVAENKVILNALVRNNSVLLEKGLRAMVQVPRCRVFLDFDVKRQWFKAQIRRLRQQASRRHGSLRLGIRRKHVFEDAYHQLRLRNADEMRSRLHIKFRNEEGVDAGGLSREFFGILAREMFNPNYALFTSTEDGCTFQPNPNSSINPDHLSYFRFVGRIVGKAVADGFLLDAHFTRSLYKHMLGLEPTHHDMEAIDPDYYKNLKMILEYSLADIGLELTFSINDISFGRSQLVDLIPDGRNILVTDETKAKYVSLVCKHRMTNSIKSQTKAYLDGFYELVSLDLIAVFTPRELELLISGLPDIDIIDLKANTEYQGWKSTDPEIEWFWKTMMSLSRNEKAAFLQFVTGSAKVPLAGFAELQGMRGIQKFSIHKAGGASGALMSAHTCFNSLDLPKYSSEEEMRDKLLYAISEGQGSFMFA